MLVLKYKLAHTPEAWTLGYRRAHVEHLGKKL